jgi:hypothetical protein
VLHTTETDPGTWAGVKANLRFPYHALIEVRARKAYQLVDLARTASSLKASPRTETNHAGRHCVQFSLVMRAKDTPSLTTGDLQYLADLCGWASEQCGINADVWAKTMGPNEGVVLAVASSPLRMSVEQWQAWNGWACHQHVVDNDHWDCGALDVATIRKMIAGKKPQEADVTPEFVRDGWRRFNRQDAQAVEFVRSSLALLGYAPGANGANMERAIVAFKQKAMGLTAADGSVRAPFWRALIGAVAEIPRLEPAFVEVPDPKLLAERDALAAKVLQAGVGLERVLNGLRG